MVKKFAQLFSPPVFADDEEKNRLARLLNTIILISMAGSVAVLFFLADQRRPYALLAFAILVCVWAIMKRRHIRGASITVVAGIAVVLIMGTITGGGVRATGFGAFTVLILFAGLLLGWRAAIGVTVLTVFFGLVLFELNSTGLLPNTYAPNNAAYLIANSIYFIVTGIMLTLALSLIESSRRRAQEEFEARKKAGDEYHALFDNSLVGIYRSSVDGRMIEANQALTRFNGYENKEEFLRSVTDISSEWYVQPDRRTTFQWELEMHGRVTNFESEVYRHKTRERVWISENAQAVKDVDGQILYYEGTVEDITPRKRAEVELQQTALRLEIIHDIDRALLSAESIEEIAIGALTGIRRLVQSRHASITLFDFNIQKALYLAASFDQEIHIPDDQMISFEEYGVSIIEALNQNQPCFIDDVWADPRATDRDRMLSRSGFFAWLYIPLFVRGQLIGSLNLARGQGESFQLIEAEVVSDAANQLAIAIQQTRLYDSLQKDLEVRQQVEADLRKRESMLEAITFSAEQFLRSPEWRDNINSVLERLGRELNASHAYLFEKHLDEKGILLNSLRYEWAAPGQTPDIDNPNYQNAPVHESGFERYYATLDSGEPFVGGSSYFTEAEREQMKPSNIKALLEMRIVVDGRQWGTIGFDEMSTEREWAGMEVDMIRVASNVLGAAIKRQQDETALQNELIERKQVESNLRQRETVLEAVTYAAEQFLRTPDWRKNIQNVLDHLGKVINASHAYLFEHFTGSDEVEYSNLAYEWSAPEVSNLVDLSAYAAPHPVDSREGTTDEILARGEVFVGNSSTFPIADQERLNKVGIKAIVEVPIFVNERWWGTIGFDDIHEGRQWSMLEVDALRIAGNVLGAAIKRQLDETTLQNELAQRKSLIEELQTRNAESETLRESLEGVVSSLEFSEIIEVILDQIKRVVPYDTASIWRVDGKYQKYIAGRNIPPELIVNNYWIESNNENSAFPILNGDVPYILNHDVQAQLADFQIEPHTYVQSWLALPLRTRGQIVGLIALDGKRKNQFTEHHAELAVIFANQVAIALENSRLFSELQVELEERKQAELNLRQRESILAVVAEIGNLLLKSPDWRSEINSILEKLGHTINSTHAYLCQNHRDANGAEVSSMLFEWTDSQFPSDLGDPKYQNVPLNEPDFNSWYLDLSSGRPYVGDRFRLNQEDMDFLLQRGMKALLDVPIFVDGEWWGTIGFDNMANAREWTNAEVDALVVAGNVLGAAIQRQQVDAKLQEELSQRQQLIAELAAKNAELERFTYTVSHDLKAPLFTIRGFLGYLEQDAIAGDHERLHNDAKRIADATDKMQHLLNDLLELSRIGRLMNEPKEFQLKQVVDEVIELVQGQLSERGVSVEVQEDLPSIHGDRQRIVEVIQNLVENAVKFMGDQPYPSIEIGQSGVEDDKPVLFVRDNGIGIVPEQYDRVFGLFNKLNPQSDGTGIGLALVKRIIEFHGGRIWIESEAGRGSVFFFTLPAAERRMPDSVI